MPKRDTATRLVDRLQARLDEITDRMTAAFVAQIPAYRGLPADTLADVRRIVHDNVEEWFRVVREGRPPTGDELAEFALSARRRAHQGIPLEALLHAYRLGATVGWEAILEETHGGTAADLTAALEVAGGLMRYLDHVSTAVAQSYLEEREHMVTDEERVHRDLSEQLLAEGTASAGAEERAVRAGIKLAPRYWVVLVWLDVPHRTLRLVARRLRELPLEPAVLAVPGEDEVLALWPADGDQPPDALMPAHADIEAEWGRALTAVAGPSEDALHPELAEARGVLSVARGRMSGIVRLEDVLLDALIHGIGPRAVRAVRDRIAPLLDHDARHGTELARTLRAYVASRASLRETGRALVTHRNTIAYRLRRVRALTGLDPAHQPDLFLLHAGLRLAETEGSPEPA